MGILNLTPDSFFDGGMLSDQSEVLNAVSQMLSEGATIIDIGGQSTRPGATRISAEEEWNRISNTLKAIHDKFPEAIISIDTFYGDVASRAIDAGASIINDISAGRLDPSIIDVAVRFQVPYVLMHMQGMPESMQKNPTYDDVVKEVLDFFVSKINELREHGLHDIIIDPGFGFGKSVEHNYALLRNLNAFQALDCPIMVGLSRKSMITRLLNVAPEAALQGTSVLNALALMQGANLLRVHDADAAMDVIRIVAAFQQGKG